MCFKKRVVTDERGAAAIIVALSIVAIMGLAALSIDLGYLFLAKTKLQDSADSAAMAAVRDVEFYDVLADETLRRNGLDPDSPEMKMVVERGEYNGGFVQDLNGNAVRVHLVQTVPGFFSRVLGKEFSTFEVEAEAVATLQQEGAVVSVGASVLDVDSQKAALLNALLGSLLGTNINLTAVGWQGLVDARIDLIKFLDLAKVRLGIGDTGTLLDTDVNLLQILDLMLGVLKTTDYTAKASLELLKTQILNAYVNPLLVRLKLGELLEIETDRGALARANVDLFSLVRVGAELFNYKSGVSLATNVNLPPLLVVNLKAKIVEPPVIAIATKGTTVHSAATRLFLDAGVLSLLPGAPLLRVPLYLELGSGDAEILEVGEGGVRMRVNSSLARIFLGQINEEYFFTTQTLDASDFGQATILNALFLLRAQARGFVDAQGASQEVMLEPEFPKTAVVEGLVGTGIGELVSSLVSNLDLTISLLGLNLDGDHLTDLLLQSLSDTLLNPLLSSLLDPLSLLLGVYPGRVDVSVLDYAYKPVLVQ